MECQACVVQAEQVQDGGMEVVYVNAVLDGMDAMLIRCPIDKPSLNSASGEPRGERPGMMFAALGIAAIIEWRASELGCPNHECIVKHPAAFQVFNQCGDGT